MDGNLIVLSLMTDYDFEWGREAAESFIAFDKKVMKTGKSLTTEDVFKEATGKIVTVLTNKTPLKDKNGKTIGVLAISVDITDRKKMEAAEIANRAKTEFIANMSHDIRTPLTGIIGMSQAIINNAQDNEEKEFAQMLHASGEQLLSLLNSVLEVISSDNVRESDIHKEPFDLRASIEAIAVLEHPTVKIKGIELKVEIDKSIPTCVVSDQTKIHRILLNLLGNAIKFTTNGYVFLMVTLLEQKKDSVQLRFSVKDTGIGIDKEVQDKLFDRFYRINPSYKGVHDGHGIGLHIAQKYVELLGGSIKLISEPGKGAAFYFDLWLQIGKEQEINANSHTIEQLSQIRKKHLRLQSSTTTIRNTPNTEKNLNAPRLLLIEDNLIALKSLEAIIKLANCNFTSAMDGEHALPIATTQEFDLIITDIGLTGMSGLDLSKCIREWEKNNNKKPVPIVALTGHAKDELKNIGSLSVINKVLTKPMTLEILKTILDEYISVPQKPQKDTKKLSLPNQLELKLPKMKAQLFDLKQFPLFDLASGLEAVAGKKTNLQNQLKKLIVFIPDEVTAIKQAVKAGNCWSMVGNIALKLKERAAHCGTTSLLHAAYYLEHYSKEEAYPGLLKALCKQLIGVMQETKQCLSDWLWQKNRFSKPSSKIFSSMGGGKLGIDLPDTEEQLLELEQYPLLDIAKGMEISSLNVEELAAILQTMVEEIPKDKTELQQVYATGNWDEIEKLAHKQRVGLNI